MTATLSYSSLKIKYAMPLSFPSTFPNKIVSSSQQPCEGRLSGINFIRALRLREQAESKQPKDTQPVKSRTEMRSVVWKYTALCSITQLSIWPSEMLVSLSFVPFSNFENIKK